MNRQNLPAVSRSAGGDEIPQIEYLLRNGTRLLPEITVFVNQVGSALVNLFAYKCQIENVLYRSRCHKELIWFVLRDK